MSIQPFVANKEVEERRNDFNGFSNFLKQFNRSHSNINVYS